MIGATVSSIVAVLLLFVVEVVRQGQTYLFL
jgi:hypothetical protein